MSFSAKWPQDPGEFAECCECRRKPGTPVLCDPCRHNRAAIEKLKDETERLRVALEYYADDDAYHDHGGGLGVDADVAKQVLAAEAAEGGE